MAKFVSHRDASRTNWGRDLQEGQGSNVEDIQLGCLLRIADATEAMAKEHTRLIRDRDYYEAGYRRQRKEIEALARRIASLRGVITRMKNAARATGEGEGHD